MPVYPRSPRATPSGRSVTPKNTPPLSRPRLKFLPPATSKYTPQSEAEAAAAAGRAAAAHAAQDRDRLRAALRAADARLAQAEADKSALLDYVTDLQEQDKTEECLELQEMLEETGASRVCSSMRRTSERTADAAAPVACGKARIQLLTIAAWSPPQGTT